MTYIAERWKITAILVFSLLLAGLAYVGTLRAQISEDEVDFEVMAKVTVEAGNRQCLWNLAKEYYKNPLEWEYIKEVNRIPDERAIPIGTVVYIPAKDARKIVEKADDEIEKMNAIEKKLRDELAKAKKELKRCKDENRKCEAENKKRSRALRQCEAKMKRLNKALEECRADVKKKDATIRELEAMLENVKSAVERMKEEDELEIQEREMRVAAQRRKSGGVDELESQLRQYRRQVEELTADRDRLRAELRRCEGLARMKAEPPKPVKKKVNPKAMVAAVAIMLVGSIIWIASD